MMIIQTDNQITEDLTVDLKYNMVWRTDDDRPFYVEELLINNHLAFDNVRFPLPCHPGHAVIHLKRAGIWYNYTGRLSFKG